MPAEGIDWRPFLRFSNKAMEDPPAPELDVPACLRELDFDQHRVFFTWWTGRSFTFVGVAEVDGWIEVRMRVEKRCGGVAPQEEKMMGPELLVLPASSMPVRPNNIGKCRHLAP